VQSRPSNPILHEQSCHIFCSHELAEVILVSCWF
jgi:hypothetical protein